MHCMDNIPEYRQEGFDQQKLFRLPKRAEKRLRSRPFTQDCVVTDCGYYPRADGHLVERHVGLHSHILIFCVSGRGWFKIRDKKRDVKESEAFWIPAEEAHSYGAATTSPWEIYWVHAYGHTVDQLIQWTPFSADRKLIHFSNSLGLKRQFNTVLERLESGYSDHTLLEMARFMVTLASLLHVDAGSSHQLAQKEKIERAMDKMRETLTQSYDLEYYARDAGFSVSQFSFLFKRHYGTSPMAYLTELKMQRAREILDTTEMSVKEVAVSLGYEDPLYFSRLFKKISGLAPTTYRTDGATH